VEHLERDPPGRQPFSFRRAPIDVRGRGEIDTEKQPSGLLHPVEQRTIGIVKMKRGPGDASQVFGGNQMIEVSMRRNYRRHLQFLLRDELGELVGIAAGIDDDRVARDGIADYVAVAREGPHRSVQENLELAHGVACCSAVRQPA
jgi:hypothetical protein